MHSTLRQNGHPSNSYISIILDGRLNCATCDVSVTYSKYIPLCEVLQNVILTAQEIVEAKTSLAFGLWASEIHEIEPKNQCTECATAFAGHRCATLLCWQDCILAICLHKLHHSTLLSINTFMQTGNCADAL